MIHGIEAKEMSWVQARIEELLQERKAQSFTAVLSLEAELADARSALAQACDILLGPELPF